MTIKDKAVPFSKTSSIKRWSSYIDKSYNTMTSQWSWKVMKCKTEMQIPVISRLLNIQNANLCITFTNNNQSVISLEKYGNRRQKCRKFYSYSFCTPCKWLLMNDINEWVICYSKGIFLRYLYSVWKSKEIKRRNIEIDNYILRFSFTICIYFI